MADNEPEEVSYDEEQANKTLVSWCFWLFVGGFVFAPLWIPCLIILFLIIAKGLSK